MVRTRHVHITYDDFLDEFVDVIKDFEVGTLGDILDVSDLHARSIEAGFGDDFAGLEWPYNHSYIQFTVDGDDTLVSYDQDGLYDEVSPKVFLRLEDIQLTSVPSDNVKPEPSDV